MADNIGIKDKDSAAVVAATDELSDGAHSPKVTLLAGDSSPTPIDPRGGNVAHDAADSGNPVKIGGRAVAALSAATLVASGDRANAPSDLDGALIVRADAALGDLVSGTASNTDGASTQVIAATSGLSVKTYLTDVTLGNSSAAAVLVEIKNGATARWAFVVPASGSVSHHFKSPLEGDADTAWNFDPGGATTTLYCSMSGFRSKV